MECFTIYLDDVDGSDRGGRRLKLFWLFEALLGATCIFLGISGLSGSVSQEKMPWPWFHWVQIVFGTLMLLGYGGHILATKMLGRPHLTFSDDGLELQLRQFRKARQVPWSDVADVRLGMNRVKISRRDDRQGNVAIPLESYMLNRQVEERFRAYASRKGFEIVE